MSVDGGIFFSEIFPATKQSVNRKCYSMIFSIADKTELNMDIARRQARINQLVREMLVEGLLNDHFHLVQAIRVAGDFQFVAKIILLYCTQIRTNIRAIANYLTEPNIDYAGAAVCAGHLGICSLLEPNPYNMLVVSLCRPVHIDLGINVWECSTCCVVNVLVFSPNSWKSSSWRCKYCILDGRSSILHFH
eukprot:XP_019072432.1 PREDICTED: uncharacterized protein LOC104877766 isoform X4 [Vitis vinifera]